MGGDGHRTAMSFESGSTKAPLLHVEYQLPGVSIPTSLDLAADDDTGASSTDNLTSLTSGLTITGAAQAGATVTLFDDVNNNGVRDVGETVLGTVVGAGGTFTKDISLGEGLHHVRAFQTDAAGNVSTASAALDIIVDATAPMVPGNINLAAADDSGVSQTDSITKIAPGLTISGTAETGATVTLFDDINDNGIRDNGEAVLGTIVAAGSAFSMDISLAEGLHHVRAFQTDMAGNIGTNSSFINVTVDTTAPVAPADLDLAADDDTGASQSDKITAAKTGLTISGSAEAGATVTLFDDVNNNGVRDSGEAILGTMVATGDTFNTEVSLGDGLHHVRAFQTDIAGNVSTVSAALDISVDTTARRDLLGLTWPPKATAVQARPTMSPIKRAA